jgi:hypothetical protein
METKNMKEYGATYAEIIDHLRRMGGVDFKGCTVVAELCGCKPSDVHAALTELKDLKFVTLDKCDHMYRANMSEIAKRSLELIGMGECPMHYVTVQSLCFECER